MTLPELAVRSVRHYRRSSLALAAASALCALVLSGAVAAGDSVRASLLEAQAMRTGPVAFMLHQAERPFAASLAERLSARLDGRVCASAVYLPASLSSGGLRLPAIRLLGLAGADAPGPGEAWISPDTARRLVAEIGGELLCQLPKPGFLPAEAPMGGLEPELVALRPRITRISGGFPVSFNPRLDQLEYPTVVVNRDWLAGSLGWSGRANLLLVEDGTGSLSDCAAALRQAWSLADAGYRLESGDGILELRSDRVFVEPAMERALNGAVSEGTARPVYAWFADSLSSDAGVSAPYFFIGSGDTSFMPVQPEPGAVILTDWLAGRIGARAGDTVILAYRLPDTDGALTGRTAPLRVEAIIPVPESPSARRLMPDFPGMAGADSCRDWDPGITLDLSRLDARDEAYWQRYRGTPQAYLALETARSLFVHPFGTLTGIRLPSGDSAGLPRKLAQAFPPEAAGFALRDLQTEGLQAVSNGVDFGTLFLGLNTLLMGGGFFLALLVIGLSLEGRAREFALYRSVGWSLGRLRRLLAWETALVCLPGALAGALAGLGYDALIIAGLNGVWTGVANVRLEAQAGFRAPILAIAATVVGQLALMCYALRRLERSRCPAGPARKPGRSWKTWGLAGAGSLAGAALLPAIGAWGAPLPAVAAFFTAGFLVLLATACLLRCLLASPPFTRQAISRAGLQRRQLHHRQRRISLSAISLASGLFLVLGIGGFLPETADPDNPRAAAGGFPWLVTSTQALSRDDLDRIGRWRPLGIRVRDGTDASCLNIRRSANPPIYGVDPDRLSGRFSLAQGPGDPWALLAPRSPDRPVPVLVDSTVLEWGLGKKTGDRMDCLSEDGTVVPLEIAGALADSVFQGALLMSEADFRRLFPSESGYRLCLLDTAGDEAGLASLVRQLRPRGATIESGQERLARFQGVERGYLTIFLVLGGLGLALACLGFAIQAIRSAQEDAASLRLLGQLGWPWPQVRRRIVAEPALAFAWGASGGVAAAWLALQGQAAWTDWSQWWLLVLSVLASGLLALAIAAWRLGPPAPEHDL
jgi:hypothetical protein